MTHRRSVLCSTMHRKETNEECTASAEQNSCLLTHSDTLMHVVTDWKSLEARCTLDATNLHRHPVNSSLIILPNFGGGTRTL